MTESAGNPEGFQASRGRARPAARGRNRPATPTRPLKATAPTTPTSAVDVVVEAIKAMRDRGLTNPDALLSFASPEAILETCQWFDVQRGIGPGMLAKAIQEGGRKTPRPGLAQEEEYGREIQTWLERSFPEFGAHPAAVIAVIRLHFLAGKGCLTVSEHGPVIRGAVDRWDARAAADVLACEETT